MKVVIIGGGITGMFVAYYLLKDGHGVVLIDNNAERVPTTVFNAGLITPSTGAVPPIGMSTILAPYVGRQGPVYISLLEVLRNLGWFKVGLRRGLSGYEDAIIGLGRKSLALYAEFFEEITFDTDLVNGIVGLYRDKEQAKRAVAAAPPGARFVGAEEASLMGFKNVGGGAYVEEELSINPFKLFDQMRRRLALLGAELVLGHEAGLVQTGAGRVASVRLEDGQSVAGDCYVVATGSWSKALLRQVGYDPMTLPGRGLAMVFDTEGEQIVSVPGLLEDDGIGVVQHNEDTLRLTSFFEMVGFRDNFDERRKRWLMERADRYLAKFKSMAVSVQGVGFRPCTPDQLPVIGPVPGLSNLYVATGNCRLGVTLAPASADMLRLMIENRSDKPIHGQTDDHSWRYFDPARFGRRVRAR